MKRVKHTPNSYPSPFCCLLGLDDNKLTFYHTGRFDQISLQGWYPLYPWRNSSPVNVPVLVPNLSTSIPSR
jgi:hypothetical protein